MRSIVRQKEIPMLFICFIHIFLKFLAGIQVTIVCSVTCQATAATKPTAKTAERIVRFSMPDRMFVRGSGCL